MPLGRRQDHHPDGGLGSAVVVTLTGAGPVELTVKRLAVRGAARLWDRAELLDAAGISADHIAVAARTLAGELSGG